MALQEGISRARADAAIDEVFAGYSAAKYGRKCVDALFKAKGSIFENGEGTQEGQKAYSPEILALAERRANDLANKVDFH